VSVLTFASLITRPRFSARAQNSLRFVARQSISRTKQRGRTRAVQSALTIGAFLVGFCFCSDTASSQVAIDLNGSNVTLPGTIATPSTPTGATINSPGLDDSNVSSVTNNGSSAATLTTNSGAGAATFSGVISDGNAATALTLAGGALTLTGTNTYTGATTISAGTLALSNSGSIANSTSVAVASGATFDISGVTTPLANLPQGAPALVGTTINTLQDFGTVSPNGSTINLGGSGEPLGLLTISGDFTQTSTGTLILRLQKAQNQQYDRLSVSSTATLAGTLQGVAQAGFNPVNLDEFAILTVQAGGSVVGNFNTPYTLPALGVGLSWSWVLGAGGLTLKVKQ